jgi:hypothetical protein
MAKTTSFGGRSIESTARGLRGLAADLAATNERLEPEATVGDDLRRLRAQHEALGAALYETTEAATRKKWEGRQIRSMKEREKVAMVHDLGAEEFRRRLSEELGR